MPFPLWHHKFPTLKLMFNTFYTILWYAIFPCFMPNNSDTHSFAEMHTNNANGYGISPLQRNMAAQSTCTNMFSANSINSNICR